jgi:hypothetical protein
MAEPDPTAADAPPSPGRPKVVYLMGSGHSGSTILGVTLGNCDGVFYAGEMDNWLVRGGVPLLGGTERTRFWREVSERVRGAEDMFGDRAQINLERSSAALRPGSHSARRALRGRWRTVTEDVYEAIAGVSDAEWIVDTAHFPLRARELSSLPGIELYLIFLLRDPQQIAHSFVKHVNRHARAMRTLRILSTNADLWLTYLLSLLVFLRHPRRRRAVLRHEDFLADPEGMLRSILDFVGSPAPIPDLDALSTGFPMQGNRLIKTDVVSLQRGLPGPPPHASRLTAILQLPWQPVFARLGPRLRAASREAATA